MMQRVDRSDPYMEGGASMLRGGFSDKEIRKRFVRKVYCLLSVELLILFGFAFLGAFLTPIRAFVQENPWSTLGIIIGLFMSSMIPYIALVCYEPVRKNVPLNYIIFNVFVVMMAISTMFLTALYEPYAVLCAFGLTLALVIFLTLISFCPCLDVTGWGIYLLAISFMVSIFGTVAMLLFIFLHLRIMILIYAGIGCVLSSIYIVFATQLIIGGKKFSLDPDEYILGCIMLFTQIMTLFLNLLLLFNSR